MAKTKHNTNASVEINKYIDALPAWSKSICKKLRNIAIKADTSMIEDWKWGPNYYCEGMVCGFAAHQKFVNFVFFQGALLKDKRKVLIQNGGSLHNRHIKITDVKDIDEDLLLEYLIESIDNNKKGKKLLVTKDKTVTVPADVKKAFSLSNVLNNYEQMSFSHRKEYMLWINDAKKEETRTKRINKAIEVLKKKQGLNDKYLKK
jgi:uncharacterized protein YdeI (YjbR/CyaY-like superfamily)